MEIELMKVVKQAYFCIKLTQHNTKISFCHNAAKF